MAGLASWIRRNFDRRAVLGLGAALVFAAGVDVAIWRLKHNGSGVPAKPGAVTPIRGQHLQMSGSLSDRSRLLVGAKGNAAYYILWLPGRGEIGGNITQDLVVSADSQGQTTPDTDESTVQFTGTVSRSRVRLHLVAGGLSGVTLLTGRIVDGALLVKDPWEPNASIAFRPVKSLVRFANVANRLFFRQENANRRALSHT